MMCDLSDFLTVANTAEIRMWLITNNALAVQYPVYTKDRTCLACLKWSQHFADFEIRLPVEGLI